MLDRELELLGVEVLEFELVVDDGRVTTRVTVVVLAGLVFCVAGVVVEVRVVVVVVAVGLSFVAGLATVLGALEVLTRLGSCLLVLLVTGVVPGRSCLSVAVVTGSTVLPAAGRVVGVVLPEFPAVFADTE